MKNRVAYECEAGHFYYFDEEDHGPTCECKWINKGDGSPEEPVECDAPAKRAGKPGMSV